MKISKVVVMSINKKNAQRKIIGIPTLSERLSSAGSHIYT